MMLGASRPTVTVVASTLQKAGLITYHRGHLKIVNREKLESASCECYRTSTDLLTRCDPRSIDDAPYQVVGGFNCNRRHHDVGCTAEGVTPALCFRILLRRVMNCSDVGVSRVPLIDARSETHHQIRYNPRVTS